MRIALSVLLLLFCAWLWVVSAGRAYSLAQSVVPPGVVAAPGQTFFLDLDTFDGHSSGWRHDDIQSLSSISASAIIQRIGRDPKWVPTFVFALQTTEAGHESNTLALQLVALNHKLPLVFRIARNDRGKIITEEPFRETIGLNQRFDVQIDWITRGTATFTINKSETFTLPVSWSVDNLLVSSSTGEMKVDPLVFGSKSR